MGLPDGVRIRFDHVSIAAHSIDRGVAWFQRYFKTHPRNAKQVSEQARGGFLWQDFYLGGTAVEFIEELPGRQDFIAEFLRRRGEGMHHLSFEVDRLEPVVAACKVRGVRIVDEYALADGTRTAFISPRSAFGALIQFWQPLDYNQPTPRPAADGRVRFDHIAIAVRDLERAIAFFTDNFGAQLTTPPTLSSTQGNFMLAQVEIPGLKLEFIQSPGPGVADDFVASFIERRGEGLHHFTLDVKDFDGLLHHLARDDVRTVGKEINWRGERQFFISPRAAFGTLIQIWDGLAGPAQADG
ncbi:MAG TPA: VOC family protein [Candidatus Binataceae bacterium]|nr:VOC family protein [Candidatus Binataceae bacterium]